MKYTICAECGRRSVAAVCRECKSNLKRERDRKALIAEIRAWQREHDQVPASRDMANTGAGRCLFGSWNRALQAAGFEPRRQGARKAPLRLGAPDRIPLRDRPGDVRAWAIVDEDQHAPLSRFYWSLGSDGYAYRSTPAAQRQAGKSKRIAMHRELLGLEPGDGIDADHINGDRLDNRLANLRTCTRAENLQNNNARRGRSPFRGVAWDGANGKWHAKASRNNKTVYIGIFDTDLEAGIAAQLWRDEHMPFSKPDAALVAELGAWPGVVAA